MFYLGVEKYQLMPFSSALNLELLWLLLLGVQISSQGKPLVMIFIFFRAVKETAKGCYGIRADSSADIAYALVGDTANS